MQALQRVKPHLQKQPAEEQSTQAQPPQPGMQPAAAAPDQATLAKPDDADVASADVTMTDAPGVAHSAQTSAAAGAHMVLHPIFLK